MTTLIDSRYLLRKNLSLVEISNKTNEISDAINDVQEYSYQYNVELISVSERDEGESAATSTALCFRLFREIGVEIRNYDIYIAYRVPNRNASSGQKPIVCKFVS